MPSLKNSFLPCALLGILLLANSTWAADWPRFRGPTGDGNSAEATAPLQWSDKENLVWRAELPGPGASSPIVVGDRLFVTAYSGYGVDAANPGDPAQLTRHALCFSRADGKPLWSRDVKHPSPDKPFAGRYLTTHGYASSTPVSDGQAVYFFFGQAGVAAFRLNGEKLWQVSVGEGTHEWGTGASPILHGDLLIVNAAMESDSLLALNKQTGKMVWKATGFPRAWNTPALVKTASGLELVLSMNGRIRAFDPATGKELWSCVGIKAAELCPSPVAYDGVIYLLGSPKGEAMAVRAGGRGDVSQTHVLWRLNKGSNVSSPVYHAGHLYWVNDSRGVAYCVKAASGEVVYEERLLPRADRYYASPLLAGGRIYYVGRGAGAVVLAAKPTFEVLARNVIAGDGSTFNGSPALVDGQLFLRSDRYLYRLGSR